MASRPPIIAYLLLPEADRNLAHLLYQNLVVLLGYVSAFREAVELADFCDLNRPPLELLKDGRRLDLVEARVRFTQWKMLAGRDAVVTLKNFATAHDTIDKQGARIPAVKALRNEKTLKLARQRFKAAFPSHDALRTAVAHGDLRRNENEAARHTVPGTSISIGFGMTGRNMGTSVKGDMRTIGLTHDSVSALEEVTSLIYEGYRPCEAIGS